MKSPKPKKLYSFTQSSLSIEPEVVKQEPDFHLFIVYSALIPPNPQMSQQMTLKGIIKGKSLRTFCGSCSCSGNFLPDREDRWLIREHWESPMQQSYQSHKVFIRDP